METLRVLMVEDEAAMRAAVSRALSRYTLRLPDIEGEYGFAIEEAGSAEEGLARIEASPPDIVLLDHKLPGMSGVELLGILAEKQPPVSFLTVMMTAYATLENAVVATKRGAYDFLAKPFTPDELRSVVSKTTRHLLLTRETRRLAQEKRQVRFQLLSVIVHELKAPLAAIQGYLYILKDRTGGEEVEVYDRAIDRSLVRIEGMRKLIMDLLDLTRLESGQKRRELAPLD
ncbi:MAG TPA: response regulator, partial [Thermoanaerobaculia bacterium]|nr:response regulator [Thermoanaerobaculia bacterium]